MDPSGRVALVTGAGRGLGRAMALGLAAAGAKVAVSYLKSEERAAQVVAQIREAGGIAESYRGDVASENAVRRLRVEVEDDLGPVRILVNNAGVVSRPGSWDLIDGDAIDRTLAVNLKSAILAIKTFAPGMIGAHEGRIINVVSTYAIHGDANVLAYAAAKAGLINVTYAMARELGKYGITVNAIAPGNFRTEMTLSAGGSFIEAVTAATPLGRLGQPNELMEVINFLVSSQFITGHVLVVDGGHMLNL